MSSLFLQLPSVYILFDPSLSAATAVVAGLTSAEKSEKDDFCMLNIFCCCKILHFMQVTS